MLGDSILDAAIKTYQPADSFSEDEENAQKIQSNQSMLAQQQLQLGEEEQELPLKAALVREQTKNSLLANAIATSPDAQTWDANMKRLGQEFPEAQQYVGRYSPVLQSRLMGVYSGQPEAAVGGTTSEAGLEPAGTTAKAGSTSVPTANLDLQFAQTTPEQRASSLKNFNAFSTALEQVGDEGSWNAMRKQLDAQGVPLMDQLGDYSPIKAASLYQRVQPIISYLQNRVIADQAGVPPPQAPADIKAVGNSLFAVDPNNPYAPATNIGTSQKFSAASNPMGPPVIYDTTTGKPAPSGDGTFGFDDLAARINHLENGNGDRTAQNPNSSATGDGQFIDATWLKTVKAARPEIAQNMSDAQILQLRKDPAFSQEMTAENAKNNAPILAAAGQHVNATSLTLAHRFGPQGALAVLNAAPNAPMASILPPAVIKANPQLANLTAGAYTQQLANQVGIDTIGAPGGAPADVSNLHGDDFLKTLAPGMAAEVKGLASGSIPFPTGISMSRLQPLIAAASQYDPSLDATNYTSRFKTRNDFTPGGQVGKNIVALNRVVQHAANTLLPAFQALDNSSVPMWNGAVNKISETFGGAAPTNARQAVDAVASEARKVFAASGAGNLQELNNWQQNFPVNGSPAQQLGALKTFGGLLQSQIDTMQDQWDKNMGANNKMPVRTLFSPEGRQAVDKLNAIDPTKGFEQFTQPSQTAAGWTVKVVGGK